MTGDTGGGRLVIDRPRGVWRDISRRYKIVVDDEEVGTVARGSQLVVGLQPGSHRVQARLDWTGSPVVDVTIRSGDDCHLTVSPAGNALQAYQGLSKHGYLKLELK